MQRTLANNVSDKLSLTFNADTTMRQSGRKHNSKFIGRRVRGRRHVGSEPRWLARVVIPIGTSLEVRDIRRAGGLIGAVIRRTKGESS
jgi:hypothetical protein